MTGAFTRICSPGSLWDFDDLLGLYRRMPKVERPRQLPQWGDERAGPCQDFVWHDLRRWWVTDDELRLIVMPLRYRPFWVPLVRDVIGTRYDIVSEIAAHAA